jgi:hypothetical protein
MMNELKVDDRPEESGTFLLTEQEMTEIQAQCYAPWRPVEIPPGGSTVLMAFTIGPSSTFNIRKAFRLLEAKILEKLELQKKEK